MSYPVYFTGLTGPLGLMAIIGTGYLAYKIGKKSGQFVEGENAGDGIADKVIKGAMRTACKAKIEVEKTLVEKKKKFSDMWDEAKREAGN